MYMSKRLRYLIRYFPGLMFSLALDTISRIDPIRTRFQKELIRRLYESVSARDKTARVTFMNYGYANAGIPYVDEEIRNQYNNSTYGVQLYRRVINGVTILDKNVLEIGCGRGGGAAFVAEYFHPHTLIGIDLSDKAIEFCRNHYRIEGLSFTKGDAEDLQFAGDSFDAVINIESSHSYPRMEQFLSEVARVLRPEGHFLFADLRSTDQVDALRQQFERSGLVILQEEWITPNVLRALELDTGRRLANIQRLPRALRPSYREFAGVKGSKAFEMFGSGALQYLRFVLQKVEQ